MLGCGGKTTWLSAQSIDLLFELHSSHGLSASRQQVISLHFYNGLIFCWVMLWFDGQCIYTVLTS